MTKLTIPFVKMHGAGNDYVLIDRRDVAPGVSLEELSKKMSHRRTGIGSDGIILVAPSARAGGRMEMYNSDGSASAMCGNGLRLVAKFLCDRKMIDTKQFVLESAAGEHDVTIKSLDGPRAWISISMGKPIAEAERIPVLIPGLLQQEKTAAESFIKIPIEYNHIQFRGTCLSMGNPHCVLFVDDVDTIPVADLGARIENDPRFPERTNVEFVKIINRSTLAERTWERGAGETWSCGSGACASAVATIAAGLTDRVVRVEQRGGILEVEWPSGGSVVLSGPAETSFSGEWSI
ncbi:MAG: diaminopimelate epimerase [Planctomycetota bacterium]